MRLSKRIYALADAVTDGHSIADIGTDHGYVPMVLMKQGKSPRVIMSDISEGSLAKAKETFASCHLNERVNESDLRIGDGTGTTDSLDEPDVSSEWFCHYWSGFAIIIVSLRKIEKKYHLRNYSAQVGHTFASRK